MIEYNIYLISRFYKNMPRLTKEQKHQELLVFVSDVIPLIEEKFSKDEKKDERFIGLEINGYSYVNFRRIYLGNSNELSEILIERCGERGIKQSAFIYKCDEYKRYDKDNGFVYKGYSFQNFKCVPSTKK